MVRWHRTRCPLMTARSASRPGLTSLLSMHRFPSRASRRPRFYGPPEARGKATKPGPRLVGPLLANAGGQDNASAGKWRGWPHHGSAVLPNTGRRMVHSGAKPCGVPGGAGLRMADCTDWAQERGVSDSRGVPKAEASRCPRKVEALLGGSHRPTHGTPLSSFPHRGWAARPASLPGREKGE